jgi:hypothetical protein
VASALRSSASRGERLSGADLTGRDWWYVCVCGGGVHQMCVRWWTACPSRPTPTGKLKTHRGAMTRRRRRIIVTTTAMVMAVVLGPAPAARDHDDSTSVRPCLSSSHDDVTAFHVWLCPAYPSAVATTTMLYSCPCCSR